MVTIFKNIYDKEPHYISVETALGRIKTGEKSKERVIEIRAEIDKEHANKLKTNLPSVCFSGKFEERIDSKLIEHSGFIVLDFDSIENLEQKKAEIISHDFVYACWISPSGNGLKALCKIADGKKHREHFTALREVFPDADKSGINESRVCYESYDPEIYINPVATKFTKITKQETIIISKKLEDEVRTFEQILKWLSNRGDAFKQGERNSFIYKLASACCRFGINQTDCQSLCRVSFSTKDNGFSVNECERTIKSAYKSNQSNFGTAEFSKDVLVDIKTRSEVKDEMVEDIYNLEIQPKDVIYGEDVKEEAFRLLEFGYESIQTMGIDELDEYWKMKRCEITLLTGIGNYGKSFFLKYILLLKVVLFGDKFAIFAPEDNPPVEFYHDLVEIYLGCCCVPYDHYFPPTKETYEQAYDYVSKHFFYVYPKELNPTPEYIKERFLELIIKKQVTGCIVDPFNQMTNDYGKQGGRSDKYLEVVLSDFGRFAQINNQYFIIIAHPKLLSKVDGNYPCPDVFDVADGAMWNNKMDNILSYHRPNHQLDPQSVKCELHTKKIRRQKSVGKKGILQFELDRKKRRFIFGGIDYLEIALQNSQTIKKKTLFEEMKEIAEKENHLF